MKKTKKRRRLHIGRCIAALFICTVIFMTVGWACYAVYSAAGNVYAGYQDFTENLQKRSEVKSKFADERFSDYVNILIVGVDDGQFTELDSAKNADTIILFSMNTNTGDVKVLSIPGETLMEIPGRQNRDDISKSYYYGGMQLTVRSVEELLHVPIQHFIVIDHKMLSALVDAIGGVDLYVECDMKYEDAYADLQIDLKRGFQHLDGRQAEQYVRYRSDELGSIGRVQRQQHFIKAFNEKLLRLDTVVKLPQLWEILQGQMSTSMAAVDAAQLAKDAYRIKLSDMNIEMLPGTFQNLNGRVYWKMNEIAVNVYLEEMFPKKDVDE